MYKHVLLSLLAGAFLCLPACEPQLPTPQPPAPTEPEGEATTPFQPVFYDYDVIRAFNHDPDAFTQGLQYVDGALYEGTGLYGESELRRVDLESGDVLQHISLDDAYFGEGIVVFDGRIIQLTWKSHIALEYTQDGFIRTNQYYYTTRGWGLTYDGTSLIMSDGTNRIYFRNPDTFAVERTIDVVDRGQDITNLNELEYINGEIYANVWRTDNIVIIDPADGTVTGWINLTGLLDPSLAEDADVLNGIAYDAEDQRLFVTGKDWPRLYEIKLKPRTR